MIRKRYHPPEHRAEYALLGQLLGWKRLKQKGVFPRELKLLRQLKETYPEEAFWLQLHPAALDTLLYFKAGYGAVQLKKEWDKWLYRKAQDKAAADRDLDLEIQRLEDHLLSKTNRLDKEPKTPILNRRQTALDWCDSV